MKNSHRAYLLFMIVAMLQPLHCSENQNTKENFAPYTTDKYLYNKTIELRPIQPHSIRTIEEDTVTNHYFNWGITREKVTTEIQENCEKVTTEKWETRYPSWITWTGGILSLGLLCVIDLVINPQNHK